MGSMTHAINVALFITIAMLLGLWASPGQAAEVVVVADTHLKPAVEIISGIRKTLDTPVATYSPAEAKGRLKGIVEREDARVVVALGRDALAEALQLPSSVPVIFDLVVTPPVITRPNTTGFYMATPVREYSELIKRHLRSIKRMAVVGSRDQLKMLGRDESSQVVSYSVDSATEFVSTVNQLDAADAILLLPDASLLTTAAMDEVYLFSFRKGIPLIGISEAHVKQGALLALVVDTVNVGRMIGEYASRALRGVNLGQIPPSPPRKFEMYLNTATARKMGIHLPNEIVRMAKRVYP